MLKPYSGAASLSAHLEGVMVARELTCWGVVSCCLCSLRKVLSVPEPKSSQSQAQSSLGLDWSVARPMAGEWWGQHLVTDWVGSVTRKSVDMGSVCLRPD